MGIFFLVVSILQFIFFLFSTAWLSRDDGWVWLYALNVVAATGGIVIGFLNIFGTVNP